jgi:transcriptional regulator with XRE-family HTH domain
MSTPEQIRMARAGLGVSVRELAEMSGVAESTILRFESGKGGMQTGTLARVRDALEGEGVVFIDADDAIGPGVRLKLKQKRKR